MGYAHTDLSWLWPRSETIHEVLPRTIQSVLKMIQDASGHGLCPERRAGLQVDRALLSRPVRANLREGCVRRMGNRGRVVDRAQHQHSQRRIAGSPALYAKRYFKEKFGVDVKIGWLPDSFGFNWNLPQIYHKCGIDYFVTHKLKWQVERNDPPVPFPYHLFWWEGPDGSRVLAFHTVGDYSQPVQPEQMLEYLKTLEGYAACRQAFDPVWQRRPRRRADARDDGSRRRP